MKAPFLLSGFAALAMTCTSTLAAAPQAPAQPSAQLSMAPEFAKFKPRPSNTLKVDYAVWNEILNNLVFLTGLSTRQIAPKPEALTGTKFVWEHTSPFRQEGNKIPFSMLKPEHIATLQEYKRDLETVSNTVDIAALPENEQLAYWLNLHNASIITLIAENYPVLEPSNLKLGTEKAPLHDAKVIAVAGHMMSLRDIREKNCLSKLEGSQSRLWLLPGRHRFALNPRRSLYSRQHRAASQNECGRICQLAKVVQQGRNLENIQGCSTLLFPRFRERSAEPLPAIYVGGRFGRTGESGSVESQQL
jgi:hypothetical protein